LLASEHEVLLTAGKSVPRLDGYEKVTGKALYGVDIELPGMLYGKIKRSTIPHGLIKKIDTSAAEQLEGVWAVITGQETPNRLHGTGIADTPIMARDRVRYLGEPVAAVAASSEQLAQKAIGLIRVDYEELPSLVDPEEAVQPTRNPRVIIHPDLSKYETGKIWSALLDAERPNVSTHIKVRKGDVEAGFRAADVILENSFSTNVAHATHTETVCSVTKFEDDGSLTVWSVNQAPYRIQSQLSQALGIPPSKIRVIVPYVGGGFGNKANIYTEGIGAILSKKCGNRPVKITLTREEVFLATTVRHPFIIRVKDGVMKDGRIVAREISAILNGGAYAGYAGVTVARNCIFSAVSTYDIPNLKIDVYRAYTNQVPAGAFRGYGGAQMDWAIESQMDLIAKKLRIDPVELRLRNILADGALNGIGERMSGYHPEECLKKAAELIKWGKHEEKVEGPWVKGKGIALGEKYSGEPTSVAHVRLLPDGTLEVFTSAVEIGVGSNTVLAQIAAEEYGVPITNIRLAKPDTYITPFDVGAVSSRQTYNCGNAVRLAIRDLKSRIAEYASKQLGVPLEDVEVKAGKVTFRNSQREPMSVEDLFERRTTRYGAYLQSGNEFWGMGTWSAPTGTLDPDTGQCDTERANGCYTPVAVAAEVAVNKETGHIRPLRFVVVVNIGRAVNPVLAATQVEGAVSMGVGASLYEDLVIEEGKMLNPDFKDYKPPMSGDTTYSVETIFLENPQPDGPYGARPVGEAPILPIAPCLANAIDDAIGVRVTSLPITAEKILLSMGKNR